MQQGSGTKSDPQDMVAALGRSWGWLLFFGVVSVIAGALIMAEPGGAILGVAVLFGIWLFVAGIFRLVEAIADSEDSGGVRIMIAIWGIISILIGLFVMRHSLQTVAIVALLIGTFWVIGGTIEFFSAIAHKGMERTWLADSFMGLLERGGRHRRARLSRSHLSADSWRGSMGDLVRDLRRDGDRSLASPACASSRARRSPAEPDAGSPGASAGGTGPRRPSGRSPRGS